MPARCAVTTDAAAALPGRPAAIGDLSVLARLVAGASDPQIAQAVLEAAVRLTQAAAGAVQVRRDDGYTGPWTTEGLPRQTAERLNRLLDGYASGGVVQKMDAAHPVLQSMPGRERPHSLLRAVSSSCEEAQLTVVLLGADDREFTGEHAALLEVLVSVASVAIGNGVLRESRRRFEQWMDAVESTADIMLGGVPAASVLESVLESVARRALTVSQADMCAIATPDDSGRTMILRVALGRHRQTLTGMSFPEQHSLSGAVARSAKQLHVEDAATDARATPVAAEVSLGPTVIAPLLLQGRPVGVIFVGNTRGERPLDESLAVEAVTVSDLERWVRAAADPTGATTTHPDIDGLVARIRGDVRGWQELPRLSSREFELLAHLAEGLTNAEIGARLYLAEKTVRNSVSHLLAKLGLTNRVEAAVLLTRYSERHRSRPAGA